MKKLKEEDIKAVQELQEILGWHWSSYSVENKQLEEIKNLIKKIYCTYAEKVTMERWFEQKGLIDGISDDMREEFVDFRINLPKYDAHELTCKHIFVVSHVSSDYNYNIHTCIKCGLVDCVPEEAKTFFQFITEDSIWLKDLACSPILAKHIYLKILETHPGITDELASKYLFVSLYMMEKNKTTSEQIESRKRSRVRRLALPPESAWDNYWKIYPNARDI